MIALKQMRERKKITQVELANKVKVNPAAISQYEKGKREPRIETLVAISEALDCTIDELVKGEQNG